MLFGTMNSCFEYGKVTESCITALSGSAITVDGNTISVGGVEVGAICAMSNAQYTYTFTGMSI